MSYIVERLLLRPFAVIGMFAALALGGAALARSSLLLGLASLFCLLSALWASLWAIRSSSLQRYGIKQSNPQFFSPVGLSLALGPGERLVWEARQHPLRLWRWGIGFGVLSIVSVAVITNIDAGNGLLLWLVGTVAFGVRVAAWHRTFVCLTNQRIIGISGLIRQRQISLTLGPYLDSEFTVDPASCKLARLRLIAAPYGVIEFRSKHKENLGVLRIAYVMQVAAFARLLPRPAK